MPDTQNIKQQCEIAWFSALCDDDYEFLGVSDPYLKSSWEHCRNIVLRAEEGGFDNILLPSGYELGLDTTAFAAAVATQVRRIVRRHGGEIRLCVEAALPWSYLWKNLAARDRAITMFGKLRVWDTEHNNGVLIYLLLAEHAIELVADRGLNDKVPPAHWQAMVDRMREAFRAGRFEDGLTQALEEVTALLVRHFPRAPGAADRNELPDSPHVM